MGTNSKISWTDHTWNPWTGCTPVSAGCQSCYAARGMKRFGKDPTKVVRSSDRTFNAPLAKKRDGSWKWKDGDRVFVCSWSDFFHPDADEWRVEALEIMAARPGLIFQVLTKRPARMEECLFGETGRWYLGGGDYLPNVWPGVTAEDQENAQRRLPFLHDLCWPTVKFVSIEPMLGPVDLSRVGTDCHPWLDWVIVGGESGLKARPMEQGRVEDICAWCQAHDIPFFFKQWGDHHDRLTENTLRAVESTMRVRVFSPNYQDHLNGRTWQEFPEE